MENEDTKRGSLGRGCRNPGSAFARAMSEVACGCQDLMVAIESHDFEGVEHLARRAASMWLTGHAAHRQLAPRPDEAAISDGVKSLLEARITLLDLFARAKAQIAVPRMHRGVDDLIAAIATADAELVGAGSDRS
jgi:hypothetical protein